MNIPLRANDIRNRLLNTFDTHDRPLFDRNIKIGAALLIGSASTYLAYTNSDFLVSATQSVLSRTIELGSQFWDRVSFVAIPAGLTLLALYALQKFVCLSLMVGKACLSKNRWRTLVFLYKCPSTWDAIKLKQKTLNKIIASDPWDAFTKSTS